MTPEEFLAGSDLGHAVLERVSVIVAGCGEVETRTSKSQIAFHAGRGFAYIWRPGQYLSCPAAEVVLSIALDRELDSPRFKEIAHPRPDIWQHHLEVRAADDIDDEVAGWLRAAYAAAN